MADTYNDGESRPLGPEALPEPDPRVGDGFGHPPERVTEPEPAGQDRHPAGDGEGRGGRYR